MNTIKKHLNQIIKNENTSKFDYEYYQKVINNPNLPYDGNIKLAKEIFDLYFGLNSFDKLDEKEIKEKLNLNLDEKTILSIIKNLILSILKYKDGIRKENTFSIEEIVEYYKNNKLNLSKNELNSLNTYIENPNTKRIKESIVAKMIKVKYLNHFDIFKVTKEEVFLILKKHYHEISINTKETLMRQFEIHERDFMSGKEKKHVYRLLNEIDKKIALNKETNLVLKK